MQVPLDANRDYTIVVSRPEDRPANATEENGVAWMDWGTRGEGLNNPNWANTPDQITKPGTEPEIMGPYFPRLSYTDKKTFEEDGTN